MLELVGTPGKNVGNPPLGNVLYDGSIVLASAMGKTAGEPLRGILDSLLQNNIREVLATSNKPREQLWRNSLGSTYRLGVTEE